MPMGNTSARVAGFKDPDKAIRVNEREIKAQKVREWSAEPQVEDLSKFFMEFMHDTNQIAIREMQAQKINNERQARKEREKQEEEDR